MPPSPPSPCPSPCPWRTRMGISPVEWTRLLPVRCFCHLRCYQASHQIKSSIPRHWSESWLLLAAALHRRSPCPPGALPELSRRGAPSPTATPNQYAHRPHIWLPSSNLLISHEATLSPKRHAFAAFIGPISSLIVGNSASRKCVQVARPTRIKYGSHLCSAYIDPV